MIKEMRKTITKEFIYETMEEREKHSKEMARLGYMDSGQIKQNFGTIQNPNFQIYGMYTKVENK